jgi:hypothetical protein
MKAPFRTPEAAELGQKYDEARAAIGGEFQLDGFLLKLQAAFRTDDEMGDDEESARVPRRIGVVQDRAQVPHGPLQVRDRVA